MSVDQKFKLGQKVKVQYLEEELACVIISAHINLELKVLYDVFDEQGNCITYVREDSISL